MAQAGRNGRCDIQSDDWRIESRRATRRRFGVFVSRWKITAASPRRRATFGGFSTPSPIDRWAFCSIPSTSFAVAITRLPALQELRDSIVYTHAKRF